MRRRAFHLGLLASMLGALCVWAVLLTISIPRRKAFEFATQLVQQAQQEAAQGNRHASRRLVEQALSVSPEHPGARRELGMHLWYEGKLEEAARELERAAGALPLDGGMAREVAAVLTAMNEHDRAKPWLEKAARLEPNSGLAYTGLAECLITQGDIAEGLGAAERAVALSPRLQPAHVLLGLARWRSGDLDGARAAFEEALRLRPNDAAVILCAASVCDELGLKHAALDYVKRAADIDPQNAGAWIALGTAHARLGQTAQARTAFDRARALEPDNPAFQGALARPGEDAVVRE